MQDATISGPSVSATSMTSRQNVGCNCSCRQNQLKGVPSPSESSIGTDNQPPQAPKSEPMEQDDRIFGTKMGQSACLTDLEPVKGEDYSANGTVSSQSDLPELPDLIFSPQTKSSPSSPDMSEQLSCLEATFGGMVFSPVHRQNPMIDENLEMSTIRMAPFFDFTFPYVGTEDSHGIASFDESLTCDLFDIEALTTSSEFPMAFSSKYEPDDICELQMYSDVQGYEDETLPHKKRRLGSDQLDAVSDLSHSSIHVTRRESESDSDAKTQILGCPFYKKHPREHRECSKYVLKRLKDVKQHLKRNHGPPEFYCARCYVDFAKAADRDRHIRQAACPFRAMPRAWLPATETMNKLMHYSVRGRSPEEQWFDLWDAIFDGAPRPRSAYVGNRGAEAVSLLRDLWEAQQDDLLVRAGRDSPGLKTVVEEMLNRLEAEA